MKKIFFTTIGILFFLIFTVILILSTIGFETEKFNNFISDNITEKNESVSLNLEKIKFKFDIKDFNLFLETKNPKVIYKNLEIPIEKAKVYLDFVSLITSKLKIDKINLSSSEINVDQLKKIILKTKLYKFLSIFD